jgi:hypothetical protein
VLKYDVGASGWTSELTTFHEGTGGENHYINIASREHALSQLGRIPVATPAIIDIGCSGGFLLKCIRRRFPRAGATMANRIRRHAYSPLLNALMPFEACFRAAVHSPFGIRRVVVGRRAAAQSLNGNGWETDAGGRG